MVELNIYTKLMPKSRRYMHGYKRRKSSCGHRSSFKFQDNRLTPDEKAAGAVQIINGVACDGLGKPVGPSNPNNSRFDPDEEMGRDKFYLPGSGKLRKPFRQTDNEKRLIEIKRQLNQLNKEGEYNKTEVEKENENYKLVKPIGPIEPIGGIGPLGYVSGVGRAPSLIKGLIKFAGKQYLKYQ